MKNSTALKAPASETQLMLDRVVVKGLFGRFNYDIDFRNGSDVSIFIAPNGCGKTTIFRLIRFIFNPSFSEGSLLEIPFKTVECTLSNGYTVTLKPHKRHGVKQWVTTLKKGSTVIQQETIATDGYLIEINPPSGVHNMLKSHGCDLGVVLVTETKAAPDRFMATVVAITKHRTNAPEAQFKSAFDRFAKTLNRWFNVTNTSVELSKDAWIIKRSGTQIYGHYLSHGERQAITLLAYQMFTIFRDQKPGLLLFDLPETGMHIDWQEEYLDVLLDTCKCNKQQAIVATHSPNIVNGHFELYCDVDLSE